MTREELRETVRAMFWQARNSSADIEDLTDAAITIVLEEAAKECERMAKVFAPQQVITDRCAAAIRALGEKE